MSTGAPTEQGVPIRYPSTALLCVDSADAEKYNTQGYRVDDTSPAEVYINRQRPMLFGYMTRLGLTEVNVQWNIPNVNDYNNTLTWEMYNGLGGLEGTFRIALVKAFYTMPELALALQEEMNAAVAILVGHADNFKMYIGGNTSTNQVTGGVSGDTVSVTNPFLTIISNASYNFSFRIVPCTKFVPASGLYPASPYPALIDDLTNMLGITPTYVPGVVGYDSLRGSYASMLYTPYFDIVSNLITKNQNVSDGSTAKNSTASKLARVYLANETIATREVSWTYDESGIAISSSSDNAIACMGGIAFRRMFPVPKYIQWNTTENVDVMDFELLDSNGQKLPINATALFEAPSGVSTVNIGNTADFQFTLQATEI